jgi:DNA-directed RNA polymerase subunit N (RpoN/RPB10)
MSDIFPVNPISERVDTFDVVYLPNIRCMSCGNAAVTQYSNTYIKLLEAGMSPELANRYIRYKFNARLCCLNSMKSPSVYDAPTMAYTPRELPEGIKKVPAVFSTSTLNPPTMTLKKRMELNAAKTEKKVEKKEEKEKSIKPFPKPKLIFTKPALDILEEEELKLEVPKLKKVEIKKSNKWISKLKI